MEKHLVDNVVQTIEQLRVAHHQTDLRLRELDRHLSLSPEEQMEVARLKKQKLQIKDELRALTGQESQER